jgi:hypothetical protein
VERSAAEIRLPEFQAAARMLVPHRWPMVRQVIGIVVGEALPPCLLAAALVFGGLPAYGTFFESVNGSGKAKTEDRSIGDVTEVATSGGGTVELTFGDKPSVRVSADDNILPLLEIKNNKGKVTFETKFGFEINPVTPITYVVTLTQLNKLTVSETGSVKAVSLKGDALTIKLSGAGSASLKDIDYKALSLTLNGAAHAKLTGAAKKATFRLSGAGRIDAEELKSAINDTEVSGNGKATVWATDDLKANVSGTGKIEYKGKPRIEHVVSDKGILRAFEQ